MKNITITAVIDRNVAIAAGRSEYGEVEIPVDVGSLTTEQRAILARLDRIVTDGFLQYPLRLPRVPADVAETLPQYLDACHAIIVAADAAEAEKQAANAAKCRVIAAAALALPVDAWITRGRVSMPGNIYQFEAPVDMRAALNARRAEAMAVVNAAEAARLEKCAEEESAKREAEKDLEAKRSAQYAEWVATYGTISEKARYARRLLSREAILSGMREQAFSPLAGLARYEKITLDDVLESYGVDDGDLSCASYDADSASDDQFGLLQDVERLMKGATCTLRGHRCVLASSSSEEDDAHAVVRMSIHVSAVVGYLTFSREYAA